MDKPILDLKEVEKLSVDELFKAFSTGSTGLSGIEAERRLQAYGPNAIIEKRRTRSLDFYRTFGGRYSG